MRKIFYDFEVYSKSIDPVTGKAWWMVVLIDYDSKKGKIIVNDVEELRRYYEYFKNDIFIGFNSRNYDIHIFKGLLLGMDAGYINDKLIQENKKGWEVVRGGYKIPLNNFDLMPNPPVGLKTLEGFMGSMIKECDVPFDLNRPLTIEEIKRVTKYCVHDVKEAIKVYEARTKEFATQLQMIEMFDLDMVHFNKTKAQLSAFILGADKNKIKERVDDELDFIFPENVQLDKYGSVIDWYKQFMNKDEVLEMMKKEKADLEEKNKKFKYPLTDEGIKKYIYSKELKAEIGGIEHVLGFGGIHAARKKYNTEGIILCCDIASMYPALIINYGLMSRNVPSIDKYVQIRDERLRLKAIKDDKQESLKIILNGTFGASKDKFNPLFDPKMANCICIAGQLLIIDLIEKIEDHCELIQSNTDGIFMKVEDYETVERIKSIAAEWENRTGFVLEWDEYAKINQKDVNNYILIPKKDELYDKKGKPRWKSKGAYVKKLDDLDYDLPIVNKALINYFVHGVSVEKTINECDELREFQKLVKVSSLYLYGLHGDKKLNERVLRVFADKREDAQGVYKVKLKMKDGIEQEVPEKIANTPERCFINNEDIKGEKIPEYLDKNYYIELAQKRVNDFLVASNKKKKKS